MASRDSSASAVRTLRALWRAPDPVRPGPARGLDLDALVRAGIAVADAEGLAKLSIRRVAADVGISPMSVYTHVATKADLLELMTDQVHAELSGRPPSGSAWRGRVAAIARDNLELLLRHPWLIEQAPSRPPLGPGTTGKYERELATLEGLGLDDVTMDAALGFVLAFVRGAARDRWASLRAREQNTDAAWWAASDQALAELMPTDRYPLATRVGAAAGATHGSAWDPASSFEFGLARVLDGLAALIDGQPR